MSVRVESLTPADAEAVAALERTCFGPDAWTVAAVAAELAAPGRLAWAARTESGALVGYLIVRDPSGDPDDPVDVQRVAVDPAHRRAGLGLALFAAADPLLSGRTVLLEVADDNAPALALYAALGFTEIARRPRYYADGRTALVLQRGRR